MAIFVCSFDAASPFGGFDVATGVSTLTGRTLLGANMPTSSSLQKYYGITGPGATIVCGSALNYPLEFSNAPLNFSDRVTNTVSSRVVILGDGRFLLELSSYISGVTSTAGPSTFVVNRGEFYYYELQTTLTTYTHVVVDPSHTQVTIELDSMLYVNNFPVLSDSYSQTAIIPTVSLIAPQFDTLAFGPPGGGASMIVDDVYIDTSVLGDGSVPPTDASFDINIINPYLTQAGLEWAGDPDINIFMTQAALEVVFARATLNYAFLRRKVALG